MADPENPERVLFTNAAIVDGESDRPRAGMNVLVADGRIQEVSERLIAVGGGRIIDLKGRALMPGLIDCHVHVCHTTPRLGENALLPPSLVMARSLRLMREMLMRGFTTVRDAGAADYGVKVAQQEGSVEGPRLVIAGKSLSQTSGHADFRGRFDSRHAGYFTSRLGSFGRVCDGIDAVRRAAREELKGGADYIKINANGGIASPTDPISFLQFSKEEIRAIVEEAENAQTYVAAHVYTDESIRHAAECGVRSLEHVNLITPDTARLLVEKKAFAVPTLVAFEVLADHGAKHGIPELSLEKTRVVRSRGVGSLTNLREAKVPMAFGTDLGGWMHPFQSDEFTIRARVLPSHEVIRSATGIAAKLLRMEGEVGCIAAGAHADLIVVDGDPLADMALLTGQGEHIPLIMQGGRFAKNALH